MRPARALNRAERGPAGTGRNQVYYINPTTGKIAMGLASDVNALYPGITTFNGLDAFIAANPVESNPSIYEDETDVEEVITQPTTDAGVDYEQLYNNLLAQQNQPSNQTGFGDMSGLFGLINSMFRQPSYNYGGGMGYGNPFFSGYGYGYGMNPYAGGIGSFYGNMGSGFSPSMYGSPFFGGYGGFNYNQLPYNPYSTLYNQYTSPGFTGDMYTTDYQNYLNTPFEGQKYTQDYQDYLSTNNPTMYDNIFGTM